MGVVLLSSGGFVGLSFCILSVLIHTSVTREFDKAGPTAAVSPTKASVSSGPSNVFQIKGWENNAFFFFVVHHGIAGPHLFGGTVHRWAGLTGKQLLDNPT